MKEMNDGNELNWFAIQAKAHQEYLAAARVAKLAVEVFLPRIKRCRSICGVSRVVTGPLFPGYFFARFAPLLFLESVRFSPGVLRVVGNQRFPLPVAPEIVSSIQERVCADGLIELQEVPLKPGDPVRVEQGPFEGFIGRVEREVDDGRRVAILLEAIKDARLVVEKRWLAATLAV